MASRYRDQRVQPQQQQTADLLGEQVRTQQTLTQVLMGATDLTTGIAKREGVKQAQRKGVEEGLKGGEPKLKTGFAAMTPFGDAHNQAAKQAYIARTQVDVEDTYHRLEQESPTNVNEYEAKSEGYRKGLLESLKDPDLRAEMDIVTRARASEGRRRVSDAQLSVERDQQRTDILDGLDVMVQSAARKVSQDGVLPEAAMATLQSQIDQTLEAAKALFTPSQISQLRSKYVDAAQKGIQSQEVSNLSAQIMGRFEADMIAGTAAMKQLDTLPIDDETRVEVQTEVRKRLGLMQDQRKRQHLGSIAALNKDIADGSPSDNAEGDAFGLWRRGAISEEAYTGYISQIERARVEAAKEGADLTVGIDAWKNGSALDPKDAKIRGMMDTVFKQAVAGVPRGSQEWQNAAIDMATRTNVIPTDSLSWARTIIASGDVEQSAQAANFLGRIERANPTGFLYVEDDKLKAYVGQVNDAIDAGTPSDLAIQTAHLNVYQLKNTELDTYKALYSQKLKGPQKALSANSDTLQSYLDSDDRYDQSWGPGGAPVAPAGLQADFNSGVERYFPYTGGDLDAARKMAWRDVQRKWGYTKVNGKPELMPYAPEAMYPQLPMELIQSDLAEVGKTIGVEKPRLILSTETADTAGLNWNIGYVNEFGTVDVKLGPDKRPYRYQLPTDSAQINAIRDKKAKEEIDKAREYSLRARKINEDMMKAALAGDTDAALGLMFMPKPAEGIQ